MRAWIDRRPALAGWGLLALAVAWLVLRALAAPPNHDESQYVAAAVLSRDHLIFRDFLSLQPPLHAWASAPVAWLFADEAFVALRLASAAAGIATLLLVDRAARLVGVSRPVTLAAALLLLACEPFHFAGAVVRNDMVPAMLLAGALLAGLVGIRRAAAGVDGADAGGAVLAWAAAGLLLGLAASTKLSFGPPLAIAGLFLCREAARRRIGWRALFAYGAAGLAGLAPMVAAWASAPAAFLYGTLEFGATAPFDWYLANHLGHRLGWGGKLVDFLAYAALGPTLAGLVVVGFDRLFPRGRYDPTDPLMLRWLGWMLAAGLVAALLPTPIQRQYLLPILPPLFVLLGLSLDRLASAATARRLAIGLLMLCGAVGLVKGSIALAKRPPAEFAALQIDRQARWIGDQLRRRGLSGAIASLSPERAVDSGFPIDARLATGPFAFRSGRLIGVRRALSINTMIPDTLVAMFDRSPPVAILTGYETGSRQFRIAPDAPLVAYARSRGYVALSLPDGVGVLHVRPAAAVAGR